MKIRKNVAAIAVAMGTLALLLAVPGFAATKSKKAPAATGKGKPIAGEALPTDHMKGGAGPRLDVVFVIDSTGSMGGIIEDGKREITKIVKSIRDGDPKPDVRFGMITYRDKGDDYVVKHVPLSRDYDAFYRFMGSVHAGGGADWEEHVSFAMHVAVSKMNWDLDPNTARMVFLIGDAPGHTDYDDGYDYKKETKRAHDLKIVINTIALNNDATVKEQWAYMAERTGGVYKVLGDDGITTGDTFEAHDFSEAGAAAEGADPAAPSSGFGRIVTEAVKAEAAKKGTVYKDTPKVTPKKGGGKKKPKK